MNFEPIIFGEEFEGRDEELLKIKRYMQPAFHFMAYRTNDLIHSKRTRFHLESAAEDIRSVYSEKMFNIDYARALSEVHDDIEIIPEIGDIQLSEKESMSPKELSKLEESEINSIPRLIKMFGPIVNGFDYYKLLLDSKKKITIESHFVSFFDKFDGAGEACHEIWSGNSDFIWPAGGRNGTSGGYIRRLNEFPEKYPDMKPFFEKFPEYLPKPFDFRSAANEGTFHTRESLKENSGFPLYERWKKNVMKNEGFENLINIIEFQ